MYFRLRNRKGSSKDMCRGVSCSQQSPTEPDFRFVAFISISRNFDETLFRSESSVHGDVIESNEFSEYRPLPAVSYTEQ